MTAHPNQVLINDLARELEVKSKTIIELLPEIGVTEKKTHPSSIDEAVAVKVRQHFRALADAEAQAEAAAVAEKAAREAAVKAARLRPAAAPGCDQFASPDDEPEWLKESLSDPISQLDQPDVETSNGPAEASRSIFTVDRKEPFRRWLQGSSKDSQRVKWLRFVSCLSGGVSAFFTARSLWQSNNHDPGSLAITLAVLIALPIWLLPSLVGMRRKHATGITLLNVFGIYPAIWISALAWAVWDEEESRTNKSPNRQDAHANFSPRSNAAMSLSARIRNVLRRAVAPFLKISVPDQMGNTRILLRVLGFVIVLLFAWFIWPTPYKYDRTRIFGLGSEVELVRINRFTGKVEVLGLGHWVVISSDEPPSPGPSEELLPQDVLAKVEGNCKCALGGFLECEIYNGTNWELKELTVHFRLLDKEGNLSLERDYKLLPKYPSVGNPLEVADFSARLGFDYESGQTFTWRIAQAKGLRPPK